MQEMKTREGKTLIVGLGRTGLSCVRFLAARGIPVAVTDSREQPPGLAELCDELPDTALFLGGFEPSVFEAAERLIVSPGVPVQEPLIRKALERGVPVLGDVELFAREAAAPVAAITGSNGKSTVTTLLGEMAAHAGWRVKVGGNLGEPALDLLALNTELYVLELSSFQLGTTHSLAAKVAVVLNISTDHMDRYPDLGAYAAVKAGIYQGTERPVFNRDDPCVMAMRSEGENALFFTLLEPGKNEFGLRRIDGEEWLCHAEQALLPAAEVRMPGRHNLANALAALAMGHALGLPLSAMLDALRGFCGLPHRTQYVSERNGVRWYNDSKGTNTGATVAALEGLASPGAEGRTVLIAGGDCKDADFSVLAPVVARYARSVVLIGRDAPRMERALAGSVPLLHAAGMEEAVRLAAEQTQPGDRVLLSPACASFDMFSGYRERGDAFMDAVGRLSP